MLNRYQFIGNLGQVADVRFTESGDSVISFSVAVSEKYTTKQGQEVENTTWVKCSYWRKKEQSTKIADYLIKGTKVLIEGKPAARFYTDKQGQTQSSLEVTVSSIQLLGSKNDTPQTNYQSAPEQTTTERIYNPAVPAENPFNSPVDPSLKQDDDLLPF